MTAFRQRLKLNKNKTYKTLLEEVKTKQTSDLDVISTPGISIPQQLEPTKLPDKLSKITEQSEKIDVLEEEDLDKDANKETDADTDRRDIATNL